MYSAADVEAELLKPDRGKRTSAQNLGLLVASVAVFAATGLLRSSWTYLGILIVVLFIHELGHWLAMRYFGYRDIQMFFIPFFGAAVSGKFTKTTGVRKAIVALAGPAPGIVIGIIAGFIYLKWRKPLFLRYAITSVFINGLNLLPIFPLDGGRFMEAVVFSRHPVVEIVFKVLAVAALAALALRLSSISLGFLALVTLLLVRETYYQCRIVGRLREISGGRAIPESDHMPMELLEPIMPDLAAGVSQGNMRLKVLAGRAESVWRRFSQPPPGLGPTSALLGIYCAIFIFGITGALVFISANRALAQSVVIAHRVTADGRTVLVEEAYWNQHKIAEAQLNDQGLYDGPATMWTDKGVKTRDGNWSKGFWQGDWTTYGPDGAIQSIVTYDNGRPVKYQVSGNGKLTTIAPEAWPMVIKLSMQAAPRRTRQKLAGN